MTGIFASTGIAGNPEPAPARPWTQSVSYADHATLQRDADMTQRMSTPNATGPMQNGQIIDALLTHSSNPLFVLQLEQHQRDINQMLGLAP